MNRIFPEQLASNLNSHLAKVYFLVGTDPLSVSYTHLTLPTICSV